ncbi:hypothetical protein Tco_1337795 [Tanacetum coccineum]
MTGDGDLQPANGNLQPKTVIFFRLSSTDDLIADPRYFCMAKTQLAKGAFNIILTKTRIALDSSWNAMNFVYCYDMDFVFDSWHEKLRALLNSYLEEHRKRRAIEACRVVSFLAFTIDATCLDFTDVLFCDQVLHYVKSVCMQILSWRSVNAFCAVKVGMGDLAQSSAMQMGLMTAYPPFKFDTNHNLSVVLAHSNYSGCALEEQDELLLSVIQ